MQVLFTSDLHLGHKSIHKYREDFTSSNYHDKFILSKIAQLTKRDILYVLGDFLFDSPQLEAYLQIISKLPCRIKLVPGNHDSKFLYTQTIAQNLTVELPLFSYKSMWVSHCPIHPNELRNRIGNIHGHLHKEVLPDTRYFNVNIDVNDYNFVPLEKIVKTLKD